MSEFKSSVVKENIKKMFYGTGRRKTSIARVYLYDKGSGKIKINKKQFDQYFFRGRDRKAVLRPLVLTSTDKKFNILINVSGGGLTGQSDAVKLGIARALLQYDSNLKSTLSKEKLLTRDSRKVERKKCGVRGARRRPQFTKR